MEANEAAELIEVVLVDLQGELDTIMTARKYTKRPPYLASGRSDRVEVMQDKFKRTGQALYRIQERINELRAIAVEASK
jgi:hypothetical protein